MATAASIRVVKTFTYRGSARQWSNRYYFSDGAPADAAKWLTLSDAVVTAEKACLPSGVNTCQIIQTVGYAAGSEIPVYTKSYTTNGTFSVGANWIHPGDCAVMVRYSTAARTSKNHPIYLFNYYHDVVGASAAASDDVNATQLSAFQTYATAWISGFSDGVVNHHRCGPEGDLATGQLVGTHIRHRDFPAA